LTYNTLNVAALPTANRLRLNHPATVLRKWRAKTQTPTQSRKSSPKAAHRSAAALRAKQLRVDLDAANAHIVELEAARDAEAAAAFEADSVRVANSVAAANRTFSTQGHIRLFLICEKEKSESKQRSAF
jgi:hypothetical protein